MRLTLLTTKLGGMWFRRGEAFQQGLLRYVHRIDTMLVRRFHQRAAVGKLLFHTRSIDHHGGESP